MILEPSLLGIEAIAIRVEAIALRLEAIALRLEAIALGLEAITLRLEAIAIRLEAIATGELLVLHHSLFWALWSMFFSSSVSGTGQARPTQIGFHQCWDHLLSLTFYSWGPD